MMRNKVHTYKHHVVHTIQPESLQADTTRRASHKKIFFVLRFFLVLLFVSGIFLSLVPRGRAIARAALLLPTLITASQPAPLVLSGEPIRHTQMTVPSRSGTVYLDIYAPSTSVPLITDARGGILIIPGVGDNRQVPQLVNLSQALARSGMIVMDMTTPTLMAYDISAQDSDAAVQAFNAFANLPGMQGKHIGLIAFSAGVPVACFAAADPRIRDKVASVTLFGGYFNTEGVLRAFGRRAIDIDGHTEHWQPTDVPILTLTNVITKPLAPAERSRIIQALAPHGKALTANELAQLSPGARAAYHLLIGDEPNRVDQNIVALPAAIHAELTELSPSRAISQIRAPMFLLHDRNDMSIPVTESRDFAAALAHLHYPYEYVEFHIFDHVEVLSNLKVGQILGDGPRLFSLLSDVLFVDSQ